MNQDKVQFFHQDLNKHHETKITKMYGKLSFSKKQKYDPALQRPLHQNKYFTYCYTILLLSNFQINLQSRTKYLEQIRKIK